MHQSSSAKQPVRRLDGLRVIGLIKLAKAALLLATTYGLYRLRKPDLVDQLYDWLYSLTDTFERRLLERGLDWVHSLGADRINNIVFATSVYIAILLTEGIGLFMRKTWAEWVTVVASASLIPFELWHLFFGVRHNTVAVLAATVLNVVIVIYLIHVLRKARRARERHA
ncbi:MAG TPA: DUF2127 domain-containing protein [Steroidobacteraceae bacterium]|nr:DUF2127 domain-containing protein [Steroidobacteraceae bacterium]